MKRTPSIQYENTVSGIFIRRINRFVAEIDIEGQREPVHVKNTGRLGELLIPGARVTLQQCGNPGRKLAYDLISVYKPGLAWVNIDSLAPNALMKQKLADEGYDLVRPEFTWGGSRFDFSMERQGERFLREVKGCTLTHDPQSGIGFFPDAPTERGVKHLDELARAAGMGYRCSICFVIQMNGIHRVQPNDATQPAFGHALTRASKAGVKIGYFSCHVEADSIAMTGEAWDPEQESTVDHKEK